MPAAQTIPCAICGRSTEVFTEPLGPFCSNRCKLVDLGKWFGEEYRISEPLRPEHFEEFEHQTGGDLPEDGATGAGED